MDESESDLCVVDSEMNVSLVPIPGGVGGVSYVDPIRVVFTQEDATISTTLSNTRYDWGKLHPAHVYMAQVDELANTAKWMQLDDCSGTQVCSLYQTKGDDVFILKQKTPYEFVYFNNGKDDTEGSSYSVAYKTKNFYKVSLATGKSMEVFEIPKNQPDPRRVSISPECHGWCFPPWMFTFTSSLDGSVAFSELYTTIGGVARYGAVVNGVPLECDFCHFPVWIPSGVLFATYSTDFVYVLNKGGKTTVTHEKLGFHPQYFTSPYN